MVILDRQLLPNSLTLGTEIECIGDKSNELLSNNPTSFNVVRDCTLENTKDYKHSGIEFVSPKMIYSAQGLRELKETLEFLKANDFYIDERCGGHIHVGASYLGDVRAILNLLVIYKYFEKEIYAISNSSHSKIRMGSSNHASSIGGMLQIVEAKFKKNKDASYSSFISSMGIEPKKDGFDAKRYGLNIRNIGNPDKNTVEFRVPNGTLDNDTLKENIVLFGSLIKSARTIFDFYEFQLEINDMLSKKNKEGKRFDLLMNLIFEDENLKGLYYKRYEENINDPMLNNLGIEETTLSNYPSIKKVLSAKR